MPDILVVDLTTEQTERQTLPRETLDQYLGGRGLGAYLLYQAIGGGVDPLSPENVLIFTAGPLHGTDAPYSSKSVLTTKSPLTGIYLYSVCSSSFSHQLAKAGFAALIVKGRAKRPTYLAIVDGQVRFLDVAGVWGTETAAAQDLMLRGASIDGAACLAIGPAGERMVPLALINAITGRSLTVEDAAAIGFRIITMERLFNVREGLRRKDDVLPDRLTVDPAPEGPGRGQRVPVEALLDDGYAAMGWDADGVPTAETLARVGIAGNGD